VRAGRGAHARCGSSAAEYRAADEIEREDSIGHDFAFGIGHRRFFSLSPHRSPLLLPWHSPVRESKQAQQQQARRARSHMVKVAAM
jgi:hypothetical protein